MARPREDVNERFWKRVKKTQKCWIWTGSKFRNGYGQISIINSSGKKMNLKTHRLSYEIHVGKIPEGMLVCHRCDNTSCVNPDHLFLGTWKDNVQDMIRKGRRADTAGEKNGQARITRKIVEQIRKQYARNTKTNRYVRKEFSQAQLGLKYGVSQTAIGKIIRGEMWK